MGRGWFRGNHESDTMKSSLFATGCLLGMMSSRLLAQDILYHTKGPSPINNALRDLDLDATGTSSEDEFLALLRAQTWDLVIVQQYNFYGPDVIDQILAELESHVDRGGPLMFSHARLDLMPEFWPMLGIADANNLFVPLTDIISSSNGSPFPVPPHPAFSTHARWPLSDELFGPDYGDSLIPTSQSYSIAQY